jgi:hypothetical protein
MADLFLSFAVADTERAQLIHDALVARGLTVFWCPSIPTGVPNYQDTLEDELKKAMVVLVLWTHASVKSGPVVQECLQAQRYEKLIQVVLDDDIQPIRFPMEVSFKAQKAMLAGWAGDTLDPEWRKLNTAIDGLISFRSSAEYKISAGLGQELVDQLKDLKRK